MTGRHLPLSCSDRLTAWLTESWQRKPLNGLKPLGALYGLAAGLRRRYYSTFKSVSRAQAPVISLGNLTVGGSGKTPMCLALAGLLLERGFKPAIISRGYGRKAGQNVLPLVVCRGRGPETSPAESGDEPWLMASKLPQALVVVDSDRVRAAALAVLDLKADILILDDGFQQMALAADCRILLIPNQQPFGNGAILPAGPLREPVSAHRLADILVTTGAAKPSQTAYQLAGSRPVYAAAYEPLGWRTLGRPEIDPPEVLTGRRVLAFCGLGRPESFLKSLNQLGLEVRRFIALRDHRPYDRRVLDGLGLEFLESGAELLVTTAKDAVKLPPDFSLPVKYLDMSMKINQPDEFRDAVLRALK